MIEYLGEGGKLSELIPDFVPRRVQLDLASGFAGSITDRKNAILEAGTGTGKTLAYLLPVVQSGVKTIVSTGTKTLQDQICFKDLPVVRKLVKPSLHTALLKGRSNYVCLARLGRSIRTIEEGDTRQLSGSLTAIRQWVSRTATGDLTEFTDMDHDSRLLSMVTSTMDNCQGKSCPQYSDCYLFKARAKAAEADVVIVNHHLLFADLALKEDGLSHLLPEAGNVIVDEAHQVPDVARRFFGHQISSAQFRNLVRDIEQETGLLGNDDPELQARARRLLSSLSYLEHALQEQTSGENPAGWISGTGWEFVEDLDAALGALIESLSVASVRSIGLDHCLQRTCRLADQFTLLTEPHDTESGFVHWVDVQSGGFSLHLSPVSIAGDLQQHFDNDSSTWIFTSATLSVNGDFTHFRETMGLKGFREMHFESPFDYVNQVLAWVPEELPEPGTDSHTRSLVNEILAITTRPGCKALVLFTSYRALHLAADILSNMEDLTVLVQGSQSRTRLLQAFRESDGGLLMATRSFWEGVDLKGAEVNCLVIDKLPFTSPDEPLCKALLEGIDRAGGNGFNDYLLPQAIINLRQGFGRLIRQESSRGLFILGDPRIFSRSYGSFVRRSLPVMPWTTERKVVHDFIEQIMVA